MLQNVSVSSPVLDAAPVAGAYRVDVSRGERIGRVSSEWFSRPDDERYLSLHAKHPGMVLLHGGSPKGAERIAACWADSRKVPQVAFRPDFARHKNAAPFKRNDQLLETLPIGLVVFPGSGISDNLADKARKLGIPVLDYRKTGGA
jgi:hypothetical protein